MTNANEVRSTLNGFAPNVVVNCAAFHRVDDIEKVRIDLDAEQRAQMMQKTGRRTVPQIYIGDTHVGGFDDLSALDRAGKLEPLLRGD